MMTRGDQFKSAHWGWDVDRYRAIYIYINSCSLQWCHMRVMAKSVAIWLWLDRLFRLIRPAYICQKFRKTLVWVKTCCVFNTQNTIYTIQKILFTPIQKHYLHQCWFIINSSWFSITYTSLMKNSSYFNGEVYICVDDSSSYIPMPWVWGDQKNNSARPRWVNMKMIIWK